MNRLFNTETSLWRFFGVVGDLVILSLLWTLCSLPVFTLGASSTALYNTVAHVVRRKESGLFSRFFETFRREFKTASLCTLLWSAAVLVLVLGYGLLSRSGEISGLFNVFFVLLVFLLLFPLCWIFPLLSRFTFSFASLNRTALRISVSNILRSAAMALLVMISLFVCARNLYFVFFASGLTSWICSFLIEPVFEKYE